LRESYVKFAYLWFAKRGPKVEMLDLFIRRGLTERDAMEELLIIMYGWSSATIIKTHVDLETGVRVLKRPLQLSKRLSS
jgi:hypothetical protein